VSHDLGPDVASAANGRCRLGSKRLAFDVLEPEELLQRSKRKSGSPEKGSQGPVAAAGRTGSRKRPCPTDQAVKRALPVTRVSRAIGVGNFRSDDPADAYPDAAKGAQMRGRL
jgi:hypothetical protein